MKQTEAFSAKDILEELPLITHLIELRKRLFYAVIALLCGTITCFYFAKPIYNWLAYPLKKILPKDSHFIATHPIEAWLIYFKVALLAGFFVSSPVVFYQIWSFIAPGLKLKEKRIALLFVFFSSIFFIGGAIFGYYFLFPISFGYFTDVFSGTDIVLMPKMTDYYGFASQMLLSFGIIFELPIVVYFLAASGTVSFRALMGFQRYLIVIAFIVGAVVTPPDVISQILVSIPFILLYQVGLAAAWFHRKKTPKD